MHQVRLATKSVVTAQKPVVRVRQWSVKMFPDLRLRGFTVQWPESQSCPGWGEGAQRIENGGTRILEPADQGDDVAFSALWATGCSDCSFELDTVQASDDRAERVVQDNCSNITIH